ncbi:UbiA family prenyltransferase [Flavihumibacter sp. R14]|nr:UbiA family prenyltransferase [Flavihumibacter soli]
MRSNMLLPSQSALVHMRFPFSFLLMPVFLFALSQVPQVILPDTVLTFIIWHLLVYPASNGYNSYFDKDEGSIALVENPPPVDTSLYYFSLLLDGIAVILALFVSIELVAAVLLYGLFSKLYSHSSTRLKKYPVTSFLIVFIFQGACIYWSSYSAISGLSILHGWNQNFLIAGLICSCLIGATYPLTQVYQHEEDRKRGDTTLSMLLGVKGSFLFTAILFAIAMALLFIYWRNLEQLYNFWIFLPFALPVVGVFLDWYRRVSKDQRQANFRNMSRMTITSGAMMLLYFAILNFTS